MQKRILVSAALLVSGLIMGGCTAEAVEMPLRNGRVEWTVPVDPSLGVHICSRGRSSSFNIRGDQPGAAELTLVATVKKGVIVDLEGFDDQCSGTRHAEPLNGIDVDETVTFLQDLVDGGGRVAEEALGLLAIVRHPSVPAFLERTARSHADEELRASAVFLATLRLEDGAIPMLEEILRMERSREVRERAVFSLSQIESPRAAEILGGIARGDRDREVQEQAVFWLTESQGGAALPSLLDLIDGGGDDEILEAAVFGISRIEGDEASRALVKIARGHGDSEVRGRAIFWLAERASEHLEGVVDEMLTRGSDEDEEVLDAAVFAVSRLPADESVPMLVKLATTHTDRDVREKALFWLGQTRDPRAIEALESIVLE